MASPGSSTKREGLTAKGGCSEKYVLAKDYIKKIGANENETELFGCRKTELKHWYIYMCQFFYPKIWSWPLVLGNNAKGPSAEAHILAQKLNKLDSSNETVTTVQDSWYWRIRGKHISSTSANEVSNVNNNKIGGADCSENIQVRIGGGLHASIGTTNGPSAWVSTTIKSL